LRTGKKKAKKKKKKKGKKFFFNFFFFNKIIEKIKVNKTKKNIDKLKTKKAFFKCAFIGGCFEGYNQINVKKLILANETKPIIKQFIRPFH